MNGKKYLPAYKSCTAETGNCMLKDFNVLTGTGLFGS